MAQTIVIEFNDEGQLTTPQFHDGFLTGIRVIEGDLKLYFTHIDGRRFVMVAPDLKRTKADNFLQGNIVFDVYVYKNPGAFEQKLRILYDYGDDQARNYLPDHLREITENQWSLLEINNTYGCELLALFSGSLRIESDA